MITSAGIYDLSAGEYHADPCPMPSLSHSVARILLDRTPRHAQYAHPKFRAQERGDATSVMDAGSALHKLILGKGDEIAILDFADYRKGAAQEARDVARDAGQIPILAGAYQGILDCASAALSEMRQHPDLEAFFGQGQSEAVVAWPDNGGIWCRGMVDRLAADPKAPVFDIKTTGLSAAPEGWERRLQREYATQAAFYRRGLKAVRGVDPGPFLFVVIETDAPYGVSVMTPAPALLDCAERQIEEAITLWGQCLATDDWPSYPRMTAYVDAPGWMLDRQEERAVRREAIAEMISRQRDAKHSTFSSKELRG
jgi:hypothetical protein